MIKDNHIASADIKYLILSAIKKNMNKIITVEVDNLNQLKKIIGIKFDRILFDNMRPKTLRKCVNLSKKFYETEASGGITLKNVKKISNTGVERISVGLLTHSFNSLDLKIEI